MGDWRDGYFDRIDIEFVDSFDDKNDYKPADARYKYLIGFRNNVKPCQVANLEIICLDQYPPKYGVKSSYYVRPYSIRINRNDYSLAYRKCETDGFCWSFIEPYQIIEWKNIINIEDLSEFDQNLCYSDTGGIWRLSINEQEQRHIFFNEKEITKIIIDCGDYDRTMDCYNNSKKIKELGITALLKYMQMYAFAYICIYFNEAFQFKKIENYFPLCRK